MSQITTGIRAVLSHPFIYSSFQRLMGGGEGRRDFVQKFIKPVPGMRILDIGCGPADILEYLEDIEYWGFDISKPYIQQASTKFAGRGNFACKLLTQADLNGLPKFDIVLGLGLFHHLDDSAASQVLNLARNALHDEGRLITIDPCFDRSQNLVAKLLIKCDRGQHVRTLDAYTKLSRGVFPNTQSILRHQSWIPYTHCIMQSHC